MLVWQTYQRTLTVRQRSLKNLLNTLSFLSIGNLLKWCDFWLLCSGMWFVQTFPRLHYEFPHNNKVTKCDKQSKSQKFYTPKKKKTTHSFWKFKCFFPRSDFLKKGNTLCGFGNATYLESYPFEALVHPKSTLHNQTFKLESAITNEHT